MTLDVFTVGILGVGRREDEGDPYGGVGIIAIHSDAFYALNDNCYRIARATVLTDNRGF